MDISGYVKIKVQVTENDDDETILVLYVNDEKVDESVDFESRIGFYHIGGIGIFGKDFEGKIRQAYYIK